MFLVNNIAAGIQADYEICHLHYQIVLAFFVQGLMRFLYWLLALTIAVDRQDFDTRSCTSTIV